MNSKKLIQDFKPTDFRVEELVIKVKDGDIKLPKFQRPFVWTRLDVLKIFDSIYSGYPIGSILLWYSSEKLASEDRNFDAVPDSHILRNISASSGLGIHKEAINKLRDHKPDELQQASHSTADAYKLAVDFLVDQLLISSYGYLPYGVQLTFLVEFFRLCPSPDIKQRELLKNWFGDTSFSRHFGRSNTGQQTQDIKLIRNFARRKTDKLEVEERIKYKGFLEEAFRLNKASSKSFGLFLAHNRPKSLLNGVQINTQRALSLVNKHEYHHIFPTTYLKG